MWLLDWLGHDVPTRHRKVGAGVARVRLHDQHIGDLFDRLTPHLATLRWRNIKTFKLGPGGRLTRAQVDPPIRDQIQSGNAFCHPCRMVIRRRCQYNPVPQADTSCALRGCGEENFRG